MNPEDNNGMYDLKKEAPKTFGQKVLHFFQTLPSRAFSILQNFVIFSAILVVLYLVLITPHQVDGLSMYPTYQDKEYLIANKLVYRISEPKRGEVVIFKYSETRDFIKRVIAVAGDTVSISQGKLMVNGAYLDESDYLSPTVVTSSGAFLKEGQVLTIPDGYIFVCGDNRPHSSDSRAFGPIKVEQVKGKVWFVFFPISEFRLITTPNY
ncbi:signal peptidase I [Candidatus Nomurabacteria bacterium]|uniref:Signal peptidase I n=1 Tax=Candidatus Dojkabacteria bacterium TaxID=2099670 RepID=A0A955I164_9BACT|nr:signal peptidase I [Candidatus Dojkabacteria bacterium]MCB9790154.1 signal peptidase I [Candidatus Nomurabacteria bacterium]MCB9803326.1 signal peptidase I [Candidatus Nomurabacteria bacterium]